MVMRTRQGKYPAWVGHAGLEDPKGARIFFYQKIENKTVFGGQEICLRETTFSNDFVLTGKASFIKHICTSVSMSVCLKSSV